MKKIYLLLLVLATIFVACKKDRDVEFSTFTVEDEKIVASYTSMDLSCKVRCAATINEFYLQYDTVADFSTYQEVALAENEKTEVYSVKIGDLLDNTTYYGRYVAVNSYSQVTSEEVSEFKTLQATTPTIEVREITDVLDTIATVGFVLNFNGGADVTKMGVCWSVDSVPTIEDKYVECSRDAINCVSDGDSLVLKISGLEANTTYYVRAYAENKMGIGYSVSKSFVSLTLPKVRTDEITDIQLTSAVLNGEAIFDGNDTTTIYGFCWSEEENPTIDNQNIQVKKDTFSYKLSNLLDETTYYVRVYAKNKIGIVYGEEKEFVTKKAELPVVETSEVTDITCTSAKVGGNVMSDGGAEVTERGICYSLNNTPTIEDTKVVLDKGLGSFSTIILDLQRGMMYYVRAYAINKKGISYGELISFTTKEHEYVDLGLSVKWATCNVGATMPEEYGDYFAWGEVEPKIEYSWSTYKYCDGTENTLTKYCSNSSFGKNAFTDNKTILDPEDDAATVNWGGAWRMPTHDEMEELFFECTWTWTTQNGVDGYKATGPNGNFIFLPVTGGMHENGFAGGNVLYYWSSSCSGDIYAACMNKYSFAGCYRYYGFSVRPVYGKASVPKEKYTISVYTIEDSYGTVSGGGTYDEGCQVTITATANSGYRFKEWNDGNTDNPRVITVTKDAIYTAHFEEDLKQYTISVYSHDNSRGTVSGGGTYNEGSQVTITATANSGYRFKEWNDGNTDNPRVITVTKDAIYIAHFEEDLKQYTISVYSHDNSRGTVSGGGTYEEGSQVTIIATANSGYKFKEWNDGNTDNPRVITVTKDAIYTAHFEKENFNAGHEYVDLGLPSGLKWATCNVGATKPEEYGDYFAWGEVEPKTTYNWSTYKYCAGSSSTMTKYCTQSSSGNNGFTDKKIVLDPEDDAAHVNWGGAWRMPTKAEQDELRNNCTWDWITQNGVKGYKVTGLNGNSIFLPAAGYMNGGTLIGAGSSGYFWSSSLNTDGPSSACRVYFRSDGVDWNLSGRYYGFSVRPVCQ